MYSYPRFCILGAIGAHGRPTRTPRVLEMLLCFLSSFWVKVSTNGAVRSSLDLACFGVIFRDHNELALGGFAGSVWLTSSLEAEFHAVIHVVSFTWDNGWHFYGMSVISLSLFIFVQLHLMRCIDLFVFVAQFHVIACGAAGVGVPYIV